MFTLILTREGKELISQPIGQEAVTIGRAPENTLQLVDPAISRNHCRIERVGRGIAVTDESRNGTFINGSAVQSAELIDGDQVAVGPWTIRLQRDEPKADITVIDHRQPTRILSFDDESKTLVEDSLTIAVSNKNATTQNLRFSQQEITFGTHPQSDVVVGDDYVSRQHCKLVLKDDATVLVDLGSTNGTFVDGVRVDKIALNGNGTFKIGKTAVEFSRATLQEHITPSSETQMGDMLGTSRSMREVFSLIERAAPAEITVCIVGESGTGKDLAAKELHKRSTRKDKPFIALNCGALPPTIIESMLFGHERGAFTGAVEQHPGVFEQADGGTLFLDEIGEMDIGLQTRLLRVLEDGTVRRLGGKQDISVDVRMIVATHRDLKQLIADEMFREDLFYRLYVVPLHLPSLRERRDDIPQLAEHFIKIHSPKGRNIHLTESALEKLSSHDWPGNVRELKNTLARTIIMACGDVIKAEDVMFISSPYSTPRKESLVGQERDAIVTALKKAKGNKTKAARHLKIARSTISYKIGRYGIDPKNPK